VIPYPLANVSYRDRVYLGPSTTGVGFALGAYPLQTSRGRLAVADRADALAGMDDRDLVATAGASLSYRTEASRDSGRVPGTQP
jgi:outer membrane scaffolding protein for murein synthesis (MipA/OmpV family)